MSTKTSRFPDRSRGLCGRSGACCRHAGNGRGRRARPPPGHRPRADHRQVPRALTSRRLAARHGRHARPGRPGCHLRREPAPSLGTGDRAASTHFSTRMSSRPAPAKCAFRAAFIAGPRRRAGSLPARLRPTIPGRARRPSPPSMTRSLVFERWEPWAINRHWPKTFASAWPNRSPTAPALSRSILPAGAPASPKRSICSPRPRAIPRHSPASGSCSKRTCSADSASPRRPKPSSTRPSSHRLPPRQAKSPRSSSRSCSTARNTPRRSSSSRRLRSIHPPGSSGSCAPAWPRLPASLRGPLEWPQRPTCFVPSASCGKPPRTNHEPLCSCSPPAG